MCAAHLTRGQYVVLRILLNITDGLVQSARPHFARILGASHAYPDIPTLLFD
jgi:hypothetical protein